MCPVCGCLNVSITPKASVLLICNDCGAGGKGDDQLVIAAARDGFDCGPGNGKLHRHRLWPAPIEALADMKRAERRVLKFVASQTATGEWFGVSQREIAKNCGGSKRDAIPYLERLAARGLLRIMSNKHACKHRTQIRFLVDPADLSRRLADAESAILRPSDINDLADAENGVTPQKTVSPWSAIKNGVTPL